MDDQNLGDIVYGYISKITEIVGKDGKGIFVGAHITQKDGTGRLLMSSKNVGPQGAIFICSMMQRDLLDQIDEENKKKGL